MVGWVRLPRASTGPDLILKTLIFCLSWMFQYFYLLKYWVISIDD